MVRQVRRGQEGAKFLTVLAGGYRHPDCTGEDLVRERI